MFSENQWLYNEIKPLYQSQEENQIEINKLTQHNRSSFMLELSGIPWQDDENAIDLASKTAVVAGICNFDVSQIDIAQRVSEKGTAPIIVLLIERQIELIFTDRRINFLKSEPTISWNLITTIIIVLVVKLVCQALSEKIVIFIWMKV